MFHVVTIFVIISLEDLSILIKKSFDFLRALQLLLIFVLI